MNFKNKLLSIYYRSICVASLLLISIYSPTSQASSNCAASIESAHHKSVSEAEVIRQIESTEIKINRAYQETQKKINNNKDQLTRVEQIFDELAQLTEDLSSLETRVLSNQLVTAAELISLETLMTTVQESIKQIGSSNEKSQAESNLTAKNKWSEIEIDNSKLEAETVYKVVGPNNKVISVLFTEKILQEVFNNKDPIIRKSANKSLLQIRKGTFGAGYKGPGMKKFGGDNNVFELGAWGKNAGTLRFSGYLHEGVIHFVGWFNRSEHGSALYSKNFINSALKARKSRGHN